MLCFVLLLLGLCFCGFCLFCVFFFVWSPLHMDDIWTAYGSMLSFDTPKEETMQAGAQFVQLAQTLYYDLARAEKATDRKKIFEDTCRDLHSSLFKEWTVSFLLTEAFLASISVRHFFVS